MIFLLSSGLYQKKNCRCASFSRWVLALNIGSNVYGWNPVYQASVATVIGVGVVVDLPDNGEEKHRVGGNFVYDPATGG